MNKLDYFRAEVQVIDPDMIAISESWTNESISDSELNLTGYTLFRKDRELDIKGGGCCSMIRIVLMQTKFNLRLIFLNKSGARSSAMGIQNSLLEYVIGHHLRMFMVTVYMLVSQN